MWPTSNARELAVLRMLDVGRSNQQIGRALGVGLANISNIFCPQVIVIGGGVSAAGELLLEPAREVMGRRALAPGRDEVRVAAAALVRHLMAEGKKRPSIVIGFDARRNSRVFARDSAAVIASLGGHAIALEGPLPTPVLAFAVRHLRADAGVMVTASHNPPNDNGYKVYLGGDERGAQIVAPADAAIAAHIDRVAAGPVSTLPRSSGYETAAESVVEAYVEATAAVAPAPARTHQRARPVRQPRIAPA